MNPLWFFVGLEVGDRIADYREELTKAAKTLVSESYWLIGGEIEKWRGGSAYRRWLDSLPTTERGD